MKLVIAALFFALSSVAFGQMNYGDRRLKADTDPRTLSARKEFNSSMGRHFRNSSRIYRLENINLHLNHRMVSQYGRGKASAMKVIPQEIDQVMALIAQAKYDPVDLANCLKELKGLRNVAFEDILKATRLLGETQILKIDYWGYMVQTEQLPDFDQDDFKLTYKAHWHEAQSYYELYDRDSMSANIIKGVIHELNRAWYEIW